MINLLFIQEKSINENILFEKSKPKYNVMVGNPATFWKELQPVSNIWVKQKEVN